MSTTPSSISNECYIPPLPSPLPTSRLSVNRIALETRSVKFSPTKRCLMSPYIVDTEIIQQIK